jgi:aminopeptidase YwaD
MRALSLRARLGPAAALGLSTLAACGTPSDQKLRDLSTKLETEAPPVLLAGHQGPGVAIAATGPARFARFLYPVFRGSRAMETVVLADRHYREPGNEGFEVVLDHVRAELEKVGYGAREGLRLEVYETPMSSAAWTPRSARIELRAGKGDPRVLHSFSRSEERDRTMLPTNARSASVEGPLVLDVESVRPGSVLATEAPLSGALLRRASELGAAAVLSAALAPYNVDPTDAKRHLDAIGYASVAPGTTVPVAMISPRSLSTLKEASAREGARVAFTAVVETSERPLRTLVATVDGFEMPDDTVVIPAHVQEPGACDNASGVATVLECARNVADLLEKGDLELPRRSIAFVFGLEMEQSRVWLEKSGRTAIAAVAADMTGESEKETGAIALLERMPDPGAIDPVAPDEHTGWGSSPVSPDELLPDGISIIARCAMIDVGSLGRGWATREHPYEGGSDHAVFLERKIPAVLFWHFPDFAYHTSLDRASHVDREEMRRTGTVILSTALAIADARPFDMERYLESLYLEQVFRVAACEASGKTETAERWKAWCTGARLRLADLCLGPPRKKETP